MTPPPVLSAEGGSWKAFIYLLRSNRKGEFYLGWTTDIMRRLKQHNEGLVKSTSSKKPFELVYYEAFESLEDAKKREYFLKKNPRAYYLFKKRALNNGLSGQEQVVG